jgi:hypothetical protein
MSFTLKNVVPWGRTYSEYENMFNLSALDLQKGILGCGDGPASFNAEFSTAGGSIVSVDPIYQFTAEEIKSQIDQTYEVVMQQTAQNKDEFVWDYFKNVENLGRIRMTAMDAFLQDFQRNSDRYVVGRLPELPFEDNSFDLALCSHFLLLYSPHYSLDFHISSINELCRVAKEVRIFPILELGAKKSRHLEEIVKSLEDAGREFYFETVSYEFQKGGNQVLIIK